MRWQKYLLAFIITAAIFGTAVYITSQFDAARIAQIKSDEENVSIDILSSETQFELLGNLDCKTIENASQGSPVLSSELNSLDSRLAIAESSLGSNNPEVITLKEQYSLLEIKDYLLMEEIAQKCHQKPVFVLYFYSNAGDCSQCTAAGDELTYLRQEYPGLRVYAFDYNLNLSALQTLIALRGVQDTLPAFIINDRLPVYGFKPLTQLEALIPELKTLATSSAATSTGGF